MTARLLEAGRTYGGRYNVTAFLGEGGMQEVFSAVDTTLNRSVALKVPKNSAAIRRFQRSAILSAKVNHPNVAKTLDYFEQDDRFYLVEELVDGINLSQFRAKAKRMDPYSVAHIIHHLAKGVAAAHRVSVVHRDLKPSNIMVDATYQLNTIKVTDFGIAKMAEEELADAAGTGTITSSHTMMGALPYLSPEMVQHPKEASLPADVWALGAIAFELLTGAKPFGSGLVAVPAILAGTVPVLPPSVLSRAQFRGLANQIYELVKKCLIVDPARRPTCDELVSLCEKLCYQTATRHVGRVARWHCSTFGFISPRMGGPDVFFHLESVFGDRPKEGDEVWYARFDGMPRMRAHPVVPLK